MAAAAVICAISAYYSFRFGANIDIAMGLAMVTACISWALLPRIVYELSIRRMWFPAAGAAIAMVFAAGMDLVSTFSAISGERSLDAHQASIQKTVYDDKRETVGDAKKKLAFYEGHLADLQRKAAWLPSKPVDAWDAEIAVATEAINQEAARGGCKSKCLALQRRKAELEGYKAMAAQYAKYTEQMEVSKRILAEARETASTVQVQPSIAAVQSASLVRATTFNLAPSDVQKDIAQLAVEIFMGFFFWLFPAGVTLALAVEGAKEIARQNAGAAPAAPSTATAAHQAAPPAPASHTVVVKESDNSELFKLLGQLKGATA